MNTSFMLNTKSKQASKLKIGVPRQLNQPINQSTYATARSHHTRHARPPHPTLACRCGRQAAPANAHSPRAGAGLLPLHAGRPRVGTTSGRGRGRGRAILSSVVPCRAAACCMRISQLFGSAHRWVVHPSLPPSLHPSLPPSIHPSLHPPASSWPPRWSPGSSAPGCSSAPQSSTSSPSGSWRRTFCSAGRCVVWSQQK